MAVVGQLLVELSANVARLQADMSRASSVVESHAQKMSDAASFVTGSLAAIGAGLSVNALAASFQRTVDQMDSLNDAADRTGSSVEQLSSVLNTLSPYGATLEQITDATGKLARAMAGADDETKGAGAAFAKLGIETRDAAGNLRPTVEVLREVAQALDQFEDGTNKTVIAQSIFGKTGSALLPMLKDLANAKQADATVTTEMAAAAEQFNVNVGAMMRGLDSLKIQLVGPVLSALSGIIERFNAAGSSAENFYTKLRLALQPDAEIARLTGNVSKLETELRGLETLRVLPEFEPDRLAQIETVMKRLARARKELADSSPVQALRQRDNSALRASEDRGFVPGRGQAPVVAVAGGAGGAVRAAVDAYQELDALIRQTDINDSLKMQAAAAKALADELERAAAAALKRIEDYEKAEASIDQALKNEAESIRSAVDPTRDLYAAMERVRDLAAGGLIPEDVGNARLMQLYGQIDAVLLKMPDKAAEAGNAFKDLGFEFQSAFEAAVIGGEKASKVFQSLGADISKYILRQQITGPLMSYLGGSFDAKTQGASLFGQVLSLIPGFAGGGEPPVGRPSWVGERGPELFVPKTAGTIIPNGAAGGQTVVVNQSITYGGNDRAGALMLAERVKADTIRAMRESQLRGATV